MPTETTKDRVLEAVRQFEDLLESVRQMSAIEQGRSMPARTYSAEDVIGPERAARLASRPPDPESARGS